MGKIPKLPKLPEMCGDFGSYFEIGAQIRRNERIKENRAKRKNKKE